MGFSGSERMIHRMDERQSLLKAILLAGAVGLSGGLLIGHAVWPGDLPASSSGFGSQPAQTNPFGGGRGNGNFGPFGGDFGNGGGPFGGFGRNGFGSRGSGASAADNSIAATVSLALVDINTTIGADGSGQAAGTGIVISSNGEVLTNNHVIAGAMSISVTDVGNGKTYSATVLGYDRSHDIALLQLKNASGLTTAKTNTGSVSTGDHVVGVGNAGGQGGTPSAAGGTITATNRSITATDDSGGSPEQLSGLIQTNADIQPGDSGGALVDQQGRVIGVNTAASVSGGFRFNFSNSNESYAVPISTALRIASSIKNNHATSSIHIGPTAFLGIEVGNGSRFGGAIGGDSTNGVTVRGVVDGDPAANAGLAAGDVITAVNGNAVGTTSDLTNSLLRMRPGDQVSLTYNDASGNAQTATATLGSGPPQ